MAGGDPRDDSHLVFAKHPRSARKAVAFFFGDLRNYFPTKAGIRELARSKALISWIERIFPSR